MNKEELFSLMPTKVIKEKEVTKTIEEQKAIIKSGKSFVSQLSINRYLHTHLTEFDLDERLNFFSELMDVDFVYKENELFFQGIDMDSFIAILEEKFDLEDIYSLDNLFIENTLNGEDITEIEVEIYEKNVGFSKVLETIVFSTGGMSPGDTPNLMLMLIVKKALLGTYLAETNVKSLLKGQREIYDISILM